MVCCLAALRDRVCGRGAVLHLSSLDVLAGRKVADCLRVVGASCYASGQATLRRKQVALSSPVYGADVGEVGVELPRAPRRLCSTCGHSPIIQFLEAFLISEGDYVTHVLRLQPGLVETRVWRALPFVECAERQPCVLSRHGGHVRRPSVDDSWILATHVVAVEAAPVLGGPGRLRLGRNLKFWRDAASARGVDLARQDYRLGAAEPAGHRLRLLDSTVGRGVHEPCRLLEQALAIRGSSQGQKPLIAGADGGLAEPIFLMSSVRAAEAILEIILLNRRVVASQRLGIFVARLGRRILAVGASTSRERGRRLDFNLSDLLLFLLRGLLQGLLAAALTQSAQLDLRVVVFLLEEVLVE